MKSGRRNWVVWGVVLAIAAAIWFSAARTRLHFTDPSLFLIILAAAAAGLTALLWWEIDADHAARRGQHPPRRIPSDPRAPYRETP